MVMYMKCGHLPKWDSGVRRDASEQIDDFCPRCKEFRRKKELEHARRVRD